MSPLVASVGQLQSCYDPYVKITNTPSAATAMPAFTLAVGQEAAHQAGYRASKCLSRSKVGAQCAI